MTMIRLQKVLAEAGVASRRAAEKIILAGRVAVNGSVITELGTKSDPEKDRIEVDGKLILQAETKVYYILNKPVGYVTTMKDPEGRPTVADFTADIAQRVYPVGRLDYDTSGLILITNDGELANALAHPKKEIKKCYHAKVKGNPDKEAIKKLTEGIKLDDGMTAPARVKVVRREKDKAWIDIIIHEGRNRQVRRMLEAVRLKVMKLRRTSFGSLKLGSLKPAELRELTPSEVVRLKRDASKGI